MPTEYAAQEAFDICLNAMRERDYVPATTVSGGIHFCVYRAPNGLKCHYGLLLADEDYRPDMEGQGAQLLSGRYDRPVRITRGIPSGKTSIGFLSDLQRIHDQTPAEQQPHAFDRKTIYERKMSDLAKDYGLDYSAPAAA